VRLLRYRESVTYADTIVPALEGGPEVAEQVIELLRQEWAVIDHLIDGLTETQWKSAVPLPGWTVQDCVAHVTGTELSLMGEPAPSVDLSHLTWVTGPFQEFVEIWVEPRRSWSGDAVAAEFREVIPRRLAMLEAMTDEEMGKVGWSPIGEVPYRQFMRVRVFDCWMHEQDMRRGLAIAGHTTGPVVESALEHNITRALGFVVGKKAGAPDGSSVQFDLSDPDRSYTVIVDGRARLAKPGEELPAATTVLHLPFTTFVALAGGRIDAAVAHAEGATITGDTDLGARVLANLAFTP